MAENLLPPDQFIAYHNEENDDGCMDIQERQPIRVTDGPGQKMNVVLVFEGEYLGGEVNEDVFIKHIGMCQRIQ